MKPLTENRRDDKKSQMLLNTRVLFSGILHAAQADCVCDIGSCDGEDAVRFRGLFSSARILAFEANKYNYERMTLDCRLKDARIEVFPWAISDAEGEAAFHISEFKDTDSASERGTSSLLSHPSVAVKENAIVRTRRIDGVIAELYPAAQSIGLWIDVEGAEYGVIEGMRQICDRVVAIHVETARKPIREGQRVTSELTELLSSLGFDPCGENFSGEETWGDVVFVNRSSQSRLGWRYRYYRWKAGRSLWFQTLQIPVLLKTRFPAIYRRLHRFYHLLGP